MTKRQKAKISVDAAMTAVLILLMGYMVIGDLAHEIIGTAMIVLWIAHNILNGKWYGALFRGQHSFGRIVGTVINIQLAVSAAGLIVSGIILSSHVFSFLGIESGMGFARSLHMVSSYWCFLLSSLHLGLHWGRIAKLISGPRTLLPHVLVAGLSAFGAYAFVKQRIFSYLFMRTMFVFFDFEQSILFFFGEYICIMVLFASLSYYASVWGKRRRVAGRSCV